MKKIIFTIFLLSIFFSFQSVAQAAENCSWEVLTISTGASAYGGSTIQTGGCKAKNLTSSDGAKCKSQTEPSHSSMLGQVLECCCSVTVTTSEISPTLFTMPDFQVEIPGMKKLSDVTCKPGENCDIPWIGEYTRGIYNYLIAIVGVIAAMVLMAGGVLWLVSRGEASKITQAKDLIIGSITGLIILASSYLVLLQINPSLVNLQNISIKSVLSEVVENGSDSNNNITSVPCNTQTATIKGVVSTSASEPSLTANSVVGLKKAVDVAAKQNVKLFVTSALRSYAAQKALYDKYKPKYGNEIGKYVADPKNCQGNSCYGHCAGVAIDVCILGTESCSHMGAKNKANATYSDADVKKLQAIMKEAGWVRYCGEWWHFQYGLKPGKACSP